MSAFAHLGLDDEEPTVTFHWIKSRFRQRTMSDARFARFLAGLIAEQDFPRPLPHPRHGGGIEYGVAYRSVWLKTGVEQWFENYLPPAAGAAIDAAARREAASAMDAAAARLGRPELIAGTDLKRGTA